MIDGRRLRTIEPAATGIQALYSPNTAVVDYVKVAETYAQVVRWAGGELFFSQKVTKILPASSGCTVVTKAAGDRTSAARAVVAARREVFTRCSG